MSKEKPILTIRVSRDGGKTWDEKKTYVVTDKLEPLQPTSSWPACQCPMHRKGDGAVEERLREVNKWSRRGRA